MSDISNKIREYVNDHSVSDHYGQWGILTPDQRKKIRRLCDICDVFEVTADQYYKENQKLKAEIELLKRKCDNGKQ